MFSITMLLASKNMQGEPNILAFRIIMESFRSVSIRYRYLVGNLGHVGPCPLEELFLVGDVIE